MTHSELEVLFTRFADLPIGVIGDFALDCYWTVDPLAALPSIETGKPTQPVSAQHYAAGAAGNVVANLVALGCGRVSAFGVVGRDPWGAELLRILRGLGAKTTGLVQQEQDWATIAYAKPHIGAVEQSRLDFGDFNRIHDDSADHLIEWLAEALPGLNALVINAQARSGIHSEHLRRRLAALIGSRPDGVFAVDSRDPRAMYAGCVLKINDIEAARVCGLAGPSPAGIPRAQTLAAAEKLFAQRGRPVFVTRGRAGMVIHDHAGVAEIPAIALGEDVDTTGAGDAAMAGIVATLACGMEPAQAACVGTLAAAVSAGKLRQTGTASPEEILTLMKRESGGFSR